MVDTSETITFQAETLYWSISQLQDTIILISLLYGYHNVVVPHYNPIHTNNRGSFEH